MMISFSILSYQFSLSKHLEQTDRRMLKMLRHTFIGRYLFIYSDVLNLFPNYCTQVTAVSIIHPAVDYVQIQFLLPVVRYITDITVPKFYFVATNIKQLVQCYVYPVECLVYLHWNKIFLQLWHGSLWACQLFASGQGTGRLSHSWHPHRWGDNQA